MTEDNDKEQTSHPPAAADRADRPNRDVYDTPGFKKLVATLLILITLVLCGALIVLVLAG